MLPGLLPAVASLPRRGVGWWWGGRSHRSVQEELLPRSVTDCLVGGQSWEHQLTPIPLRCKKKVPASKRFTIHRASNVLTLSLKRFANFSGGKITKVSAPCGLGLLSGCSEKYRRRALPQSQGVQVPRRRAQEPTLFTKPPNGHTH